MANAFEKYEKENKATEEVVVETKEAVTNKQESINNSRKEISEDTVSETNWIKLPALEEVGKTTGQLKILSFYEQPGKEMVNKETKETFWSGLSSKKGERYGEYVLEVLQNGNVSNLRLSNWECFYKTMELVRYCKRNNLTLKNQVIEFVRVAGGAKTAGRNWELIVHSLKIKFSGLENELSKLN
jgi:hypothetical protein